MQELQAMVGYWKSYQYIVVCDIRLTKHEPHAVDSVFALASDAQEQTGREVRVLRLRLFCS